METIQPYFSNLAIWTRAFEPQNDLELKSKVVGLNVQTLRYPQTLTLSDIGAI